MGIREFYAQYMNRPGFEYLPDPLGRLGQGKWVKTAQGPEAPTPPKAPVAPKPVPPTPPKGARKKPGLVDPPKKARGRYRLRNGRVLDETGNEVPLEKLSEEEVLHLFRERRLHELKDLWD